MAKVTKLKFKIEALALCPKRGVVSQPCEFIDAELEGFLGDRHFGFTKKADGRDSGVIRGTPVRNWRQWSAVSIEELKSIAFNMGLESVRPELLGANITVAGIEGFTALPRGTALWFPSGAILTVEDANAPCILPGKEIAKNNLEDNNSTSGVQPHDFCKVAVGLRGLVGVVFRAGRIYSGDVVEARIPK